ncbi:MAG TPA: hypothetical protein VL972_06900, partial [Solirubrobacteraceae bacterium]|nr:hypothetical protein [Solirubrobacteraceae bacterium]
MGGALGRLVAIGCAVVTAGLLWAMPAAGAVLVYEGNNPNPEEYDYTNSSYTDLAAATGDTVNTETSLPSDLASDSCVILQLNQEAFNAEQVATLRSYMERGGVVVGVGEYRLYGSEVGDSWGE